jgi:hypothetical protein
MNLNVAAFYLFLLGCILGLSIFFSPFVGRLVALTGLVAFLAIVWRERSRHEHTVSMPFRSHPAILYPTLVLWGLFLLGLGLNPSLSVLIHTGAFILFSGVALFVVPASVPQDRAFSAIAMLGAAGFITSLPTIVWGDFMILGYVFDQAGRQQSVAGVYFYTPQSIFTSRNYFRVLLAFGAVCAAALFIKNRRPWMGGICLMNVMGVLLAVGRAATLALLAAGLLLIVYYTTGHSGLASATLAGAFTVLAIFGLTFGAFPGPDTLIQTALGDRINDWTASFAAFTERPVVGWGIGESHTSVERHYGDGFTGIHSSYLRMFVISGFVGGVAYLALFAAALGLSYQSVCERAPLAPATYCLVIMVLVFQLFDGATIFGMNLSSVLWALAVGYTQFYW